MNDWAVSQKEELRSDFLKLVLYELNNTISPREKRIDALQAAIEEFNHNNPIKHDQELELQADKILFQKVSYCFAVHKHDEEMGLLACALEMVFRANRGRVALSFQEIGDSILPLFVEMIRWSSARRKDIWIAMHLEAQEAAKNQMMVAQQQQSQRNGSGGASVAASGIYYSGGGNGNVSAPPGRMNSNHEQINNMNDGHSLVSILKTDSNDAPTNSPTTPLRSNGTNSRQQQMDSFSSSESTSSSRLPEDMPKDIDQDTEITIECIPNGTEISSFVDVNVDKDKHEPEPHDSSTGTASTSTSDETDLGKDAQNIPSPEIPVRQRERQVRFLDLVDSDIQESTSVLQQSGPQSNSVDPQQYQGIPIEPQRYRVLPSDSNFNYGSLPIELKKRWKREKFTHPLAVLKILKVLRYFSRVLSAMVPMAHFPGLLDELIFQMKIRKIGTDSTDRGRRQGMDHDDESFYSARSNDVEIEKNNANGMQKVGVNTKKRRNLKSLDNASIARMDAIATIVNLACAEENKTKLLQHPHLLDAVVHVAQHDTIDDTREHASIVLMNLALAEGNKVTMANHEDLLHVITKLMTDDVINTRRYASATILNLVSGPESITRITKFGKGHLLHALARVLAIDEVEEIRINIAETFFNMVRNSTDLVSIEMLGRHRDVLPALATTVLSDYSADVRAYAARTLEWLAADIHFGSKSHPALLDALIQASMWTKTNCIAEALKCQASIEENRVAMVEKKGMLDALTALASLHGVNDEEVRECTLKTIELLTCEPSVRKTMARHEPIMLELTRATFSANGILDQYEENDGGTRALMKSALKNLAKEI